MGSGIINQGLYKEGDEFRGYKFRFVGIYSKNTLEYFLFDIACVMYGITTVPIYDTLGEEATEYAFKQTKMTTVFCTANHVANILQSKRNKGLYGSVLQLVVTDYSSLKPEVIVQAQDLVKIYSFEQIISFGLTNI